jgi:hypothetical protein
MTDSDGAGGGTSSDPLTRQRREAERDFARFGEWVAAFEQEHGPTHVYLDSAEAARLEGQRGDRHP